MEGLFTHMMICSSIHISLLCQLSRLHRSADPQDYLQWVANKDEEISSFRRNVEFVQQIFWDTNLEASLSEFRTHTVMCVCGCVAFRAKCVVELWSGLMYFPRFFFARQF